LVNFDNYNLEIVALNLDETLWSDGSGQILLEDDYCGMQGLTFCLQMDNITLLKPKKSETYYKGTYIIYFYKNPKSHLLDPKRPQRTKWLLNICKKICLVAHKVNLSNIFANFRYKMWMCNPCWEFKKYWSNLKRKMMLPWTFQETYKIVGCICKSPPLL